MKKYIYLITTILIFECGLVLAQEKPPLPYYDWGACPFECCAYREWKAKQSLVAYSDHKKNAAVAFNIQKNEWVTAETGVVITYKAGVTKVLKPMKLGQTKSSVNVKPGDILYTLHYIGEGFYLFWFKGNKYSDETSSDKPDPNPPTLDYSLQVISIPHTDWWVKVKNKKGQIGWIKNKDYFENTDACG